MTTNLPTLVDPARAIDRQRVALGVLTKRQSRLSKEQTKSDLRQEVITLGLDPDGWDGIPWDRLRAEHLEVLHDHLAETRAPATVNRILSTARMALQQVYLQGLY